MASFVGSCTVNGPPHDKISVKLARSNKIIARDKSGSSLAVSRMFGVHPSPPVAPPKSYIEQIDTGAAVGMAIGEGESDIAVDGDLVGPAFGVSAGEDVAVKYVYM
jgi:hypothetical protein